MPTFRCTHCARRIDSPVVIGAGDCPHCGGDVVFDIHAETPEPTDDKKVGGGARARLRRWLRR